MVRKILNVKDARLRQKSRPVKKVDKKILNTITDLKDTLLAQKDPEGIGLAAPQIGKKVKIFIAKYQGKTKVFINPKILYASYAKGQTKEKSVKGPDPSGKIMEGCLSLPHFYGPLARSEKIKVKYLTPKGKEIVATFKGFEAQIIQHEVDHLEGIVFVDRLLQQKKPLYELVGDEWKEVELT